LAVNFIASLFQGVGSLKPGQRQIKKVQVLAFEAKEVHQDTFLLIQGGSKNPDRAIIEGNPTDIGKVFFFESFYWAKIFIGFFRNKRDWGVFPGELPDNFTVGQV